MVTVILQCNVSILINSLLDVTFNFQFQFEFQCSSKFRFSFCRIKGGNSTSIKIKKSIIKLLDCPLFSNSLR